MFTDERSKNVVILSHCYLNQNAKLDNCALFPGAWSDLIKIFIEKGIGMIQLPCPELLVLGLDRGLDPDRPISIAEDDSRIHDIIENLKFEKKMAQYAEQVAIQIEEYQKHGFHVFGLIGVNGSPTCGIEFNWKDNIAAPGPGVFMEILQKILKSRKIQIPMIGIKPREPKESLEKVRQWIESRKK